jgi:hypothetical protein
VDVFLIVQCTRYDVQCSSALKSYVLYVPYVVIKCTMYYARCTMQQRLDILCVLCSYVVIKCTMYYVRCTLQQRLENPMSSMFPMWL